MKKKTTVSGEVFRFFGGLGREMSRQVVGKPNKKKMNRKGTIHIHYHFDKRRKG